MLKALTRPVVLGAWAALLLVAGVAAAATKDDSTVATSAPSTATSSTTLPDGTTPAPGSTDTTAVPASSDPSTSASTTAPPATTAGHAPATTAAPAPTGGAGKVLPAAGTYTVTNQGSASLAGKPQDVPPQGTFTITQLNATDTQESGLFDLTLRWAPDSASLVTLKLSASGYSKEFDANPPVLFVPFPGTPGMTWSWSLKSTDGKTTITQTQPASVTGTDAITVQGQSVPVFVVHYALKIAGDVTGTADLTFWVSPDYRLPVRQHAVVNAAALGFPFTSDITSQLVSLTPG